MIHYIFIIENYNHVMTIADIENRMRSMFNNTFYLANESVAKLYGVSKCYNFGVEPTSNDLHLKMLCSLSGEFINTVFSIVDDAQNKFEFFEGRLQLRHPRIVYYNAEVSEPETYEEYIKAMVIDDDLGY
jgi:hypothetical protein